MLQPLPTTQVNCECCKLVALERKCCSVGTSWFLDRCSSRPTGELRSAEGYNEVRIPSCGSYPTIHGNEEIAPRWVLFWKENLVPKLL